MTDADSTHRADKFQSAIDVAGTVVCDVYNRLGRAGRWDPPLPRGEVAAIILADPDMQTLLEQPEVRDAMLIGTILDILRRGSDNTDDAVLEEVH